MKRRIAVWAAVGFAVACFWALYALAVPMNFASSALWALVEWTSPITLVVRHMRFSLFAYLIVNTMTYALAGLLVETLRLRWRVLS